MIPKSKYVIDTPERVNVITFSLLRRYHTPDEVKDFLRFMWGTRWTYLDNSDIVSFEASEYENWINTRLESLEMYTAK